MGNAGAYVSRRAFDRWLSVAVTATIFGLSWYRHATYRSSTYDLAVFEQVVWKMANGRGATSTLTAWNAFADHFSPVLLVFVPLYKLVATPLWFFAAQAIAVGMLVLLVRPLAEHVGLKDRPLATNALVVLTALNPGVWNAALYDFHPTTIAAPVILLGCAAAVRNRHRDLWLVLAGLLFLRDDLGIALVPLAFIGWRSDDRRGRMHRLGLVAAGGIAMVVGGQIGTALGATRHFEDRYGYLGDSMTDAVLHPFHAASGLIEHVLIIDNLSLVLMSVLAFALLPLLRPSWAGLALIMAMPMLAAADDNFHSYGFHYGAPVAPFLVAAAAGGLARLTAERAKMFATAAFPIAVASLAMFGPYHASAFSTETLDSEDVARALTAIRPDDVVSASNGIAPHVADRDHLIPFPYPFINAKQEFPLDDRVTETTPEAQAKVDVVVVNEAKWNRLMRRRVEAVMNDDFVKQDFGSIAVFRRIKP